MSKPFVLAIADIHLSLTKPACRGEEDWLGVQARYLKQVREIQADLGDPRILCAGDIFDKWNPSPELIHFALEHLPDKMLCVPGQHDLPNHSIEQMHRCGYGVLVKAKKIYDLSMVKPGKRYFAVPGCFIRGSGWNQGIDQVSPFASQYRNIAVIHRYLWVEGKGFPGAPQEANLPHIKDQLDGYDWAIFGDNHKAFIANCHPKGGTRCVKIINCGPLFRRKVDEIEHKPCVYGLMEDGKIERYYLDVSDDKFLYTTTDKKEEDPNWDLEKFLQDLDNLGADALDFAAVVRRNLKGNKVPPEVRDIIISSLA